MRIPIREQLTAFTLFTTLAALAVVAIATWITNYNFVLSIRSSRLALTASLKAAQMSSNLALMEATILGLSTRIKMQQALESYIDGNRSDANWEMARYDLYTAISSTQQSVWTFQAMMFPRPSESGPISSVINVTNPDAYTIELPYSFPNGSNVVLGDVGAGYPPQLYPNITYQMQANNTLVPYSNGQELGEESSIFLGPWQVNDTLSLVSITLPVINSTFGTTLLGWLTVVYDTKLFIDVVASSVGLDRTGVVLLLGPVNVANRFNGVPANTPPPFPSYASTVSSQEMHFILPASLSNNFRMRAGPDDPFLASSYPAVLAALTSEINTSNNASSLVNTYNEHGAKVGVGFAIPPTRLCDWVLIVEQSHTEVYRPIVHLRNVLLACVFVSAAVMLLITWPLAHLSVRPIRRLRAATAKSIEPPGLDSSSEKFSNLSISFNGADEDGASDVDEKPVTTRSTASKGWVPTLFSRRSKLGSEKRSHQAGNAGSRMRRRFRIPAKVKESNRTFVEDELTELTHTFNEMSEELSLHYHRLEERVRQRTAELELSKKAAEAANESKTLFIANISHELKSPLNAILGLAAVCMQEQDHQKVQQSLSMIYKSGDLLHNLLTDLLTFSKNQAGHQITLEEKEFSLRDIPTQLKVIFDMQAKESLINLTFDYEGVADSLGDRAAAPANRIYGPPGSGRVKDMQVYGDKHRILQVAINLLSNSLKFTPSGGSVSMRIRCLDEREDQAGPPRGESLPTRNSTASYSSSVPTKKVRYEMSDGLVAADGYSITRERSPSQNTNNHSSNNSEPRRSNSLPRSIISIDSNSTTYPPTNAKIFIFEFEVQDTGPGIAPHLQKQIFEPFVQGDLRLTKRYGGTGLGLAIVSQLAKLMNGSISVQSEVGVGSTFKLRIPLQLTRSRRSSQATTTAESTTGHSYFASGTTAKPEEAKAKVKAKTKATDSANPFVAASTTTATTPRQLMSKAFETDKPRLVGLSQPYFSTATTPPLSSPGADAASTTSKRSKSKLRVLVAEDNKINQEVVLRMLRLEDIFDVHIAKDGQEALEKVKESMEAKEPYEMIFMDVQMPNLDGRQSTRAIRKIGYSAPIVALTAFADEANQKECIESGMNYFLAKPIRRPALRQVLKTYCAPIVEVVEEKSLELAACIDANGSASTSPATDDSDDDGGDDIIGAPPGETPLMENKGEVETVKTSDCVPDTTDAEDTDLSTPGMTDTSDDSNNRSDSHSGDENEDIEKRLAL